ncbi:expressed unknown protein [Seminavis robusta]|uniref:Uncharacterized protein n=1 Tax=Seminavis robusta TaxID=568900 RepID=A0A9N8DE90_9STRA|nr:expressed unknown protein [Seminavis robusta]|eukprot:Sro54_g031830.1 n/a (282) ;mRNA; f:59340-60185
MMMEVETEEKDTRASPPLDDNEAKEKKIPSPWQSPFKDPANSSNDMVLLTPTASNCEPLALALHQVASTMSRNHNRGRPLWSSASHNGHVGGRLDHKVVATLERTLERQKSKSSSRRAKPHLVHVVTVGTTMIQQPQTRSIVAQADHIAVVLSSEDVLTWLAQESAKTNNPRNFKPPPVDHHPLVEECLQHYLSNPSDAILLQRISIVLLIRPTEDSEMMESLVSTWKAHTKNTVSIDSFVCRPEEPSSCHMVAKMLWTRLHQSRSPDETQLSQLLRSAYP